MPLLVTEYWFRRYYCIKNSKEIFGTAKLKVREAREHYRPYLIKGGKVNLNAAGLGTGAGLLSNPEAMGKLAAGDYMGAIENQPVLKCLSVQVLKWVSVLLVPVLWLQLLLY